VRNEAHQSTPVKSSVPMTHIVADLMGFTACSNGAQKDALPILPESLTHKVKIIMRQYLLIGYV